MFKPSPKVVADEAWLARLVLGLGGSSVLAQTLTRHPEEARALAVEPTARGGDGWREFFAPAVCFEPVKGN